VENCALKTPEDPLPLPPPSAEAMMRDYRCCLLDDQGRIEATFVVYLNSDDAARAFVGDLLHKSDCALAEVWKGSDMVFLTGRAD